MNEVMELQSLEFTFKGSRNYIHGTSLFNAVIDIARSRGLGSGGIEIAFKRMIQTNRCLIEERSPTASDCVTAHISAADKQKLFLAINPAEPARDARRIEYQEDRICRYSRLTDNSISLDHPHHEDSIEVVVALCKRMHQKLIDNEKKWVFSKFAGIFPIPEIAHIQLNLVKQIGTKLTCSEVIVNEEKIGEIYFS